MGTKSFRGKPWTWSSFASNYRLTFGLLTSVGGLIGYNIHMTTNEITQMARRRVLEDTTDIVSESTILLYANLAYVDVLKTVFTNQDIRSATVTCIDGVGTLPADFGRLYGPAKDSSDDNRFYDEKSIADFDRDDIEDACVIDGTEIKVNNTDVTSLDIRYYDTGETLTSTTNPSIDSYFHESIVDGVIYRLHGDLQDEELATVYETKFINKLNQRISAQSTYEESNQRGGEMFTHVNLIN